MRINIANIIVPKDTLWKFVVEEETEPCLHFFFPQMAAQIDFSKEIRFLEQEFFKLVPEIKNNTQDRRLDKLIEVTMKTGEVRWLLIHIEIQGYVDKNFTKRMFEYFYRILEMYQKPITALAIFTDDDPNFHPTEHRISCWGTEMVYRFNTYKLSEKTLADFQDKNNVFSIIMEMAWHNLKKNKPGDTALADLKLQIIRRFLEMGYSKNRIRKILLFLGFYINFEDKSLTENFIYKMNEVTHYTGVKDIGEVLAEQLGDEIKEFYREKGFKEAMEMAMEKVTEEVTQEITEQVTQEITEQVTQEVTEQVTQEVTEQVTQANILKLQKHGFAIQQIAEMLEIPLEEVKRLLGISDD